MSNILNDAMKRAGWGDIQIKKTPEKLKPKPEKIDLTLTERKTKEEIRKYQIDNDKNVNILVLRSYVRSIFVSIYPGNPEWYLWIVGQHLCI